MPTTDDLLRYQRDLLTGGVDPEYLESVLLPRYREGGDLAVFPAEDAAAFALKETPDKFRGGGERAEKYDPVAAGKAAAERQKEQRGGGDLAFR